MLAVITGDIIHSRQQPAASWQPVLENILGRYGTVKKDWELFRGDSFQLGLDPERALQAAIHIKAGIRQFEELDVRMAIGIGELEYRASQITASTGKAFIYSGECFDALRNQNLAIRTANPVFDENFNLVFSLALIPMNSWTQTVCSVITQVIENPEHNQTQIAALMQRSQSSVSEALKRGCFEEIKAMMLYYQKQVSGL